MQRAQRVLHGGQAVAFAGQHQHFVGWRACSDLRGHPCGGLGAFAHALGFFGFVARFGQAVAPGEWVGAAVAIGIAITIAIAIVLTWRQDGGQTQQHTGVFGLGGVVAKTAGFVLCLRSPHDVVDRVNHARGVAAGVVAAEQVAAQAIAHKGLRGDEHLWLGAAKAVNALFRVAHNKHAGRLLPTGATTRARIAR